LHEQKERFECLIRVSACSIAGRKLFDTEGKVREIEDYLRPIITERAEKAAAVANDDSSVSALNGVDIAFYLI
jgi:hypothetical protein